MSGPRRLAVALSVAWVSFFLFGYYTDPSPFRIGPFMVLGVCPVAVPWAVWWVWRGFRSAE